MGARIVVIEDNPANLELELTGLRRDGSAFPVEISLSPLDTEDGTLVSSAIRDVTERKRFEQALHDKNTELENAALVKDRFLASMSLGGRITFRSEYGKGSTFKLLLFGN